MVEILVNQASTPTAAASAYKARDVVNAPAIKERIQTRSAARGDASDVAAWMGNHFYRYVIGNVQADAPAVLRITDAKELQDLMGRKEPPAWALERLAKKGAGINLPDLWWVDPDSSAVATLESRLVEFLSTRKGTSLEGKLQRINAPQALARWTLEHLAFEKKQSSGRVEHHKDAVRGLLPGQHGIFFEFDSKNPNMRQEMAYESQMMGHCVGQFADRKNFQGGYGEHYAEGLESGRMRLFSYRTGSAQPRITVNAYVQKDGSLKIEQIKGKQNRPPIARYAPDVVALLNHLPLNDTVSDDAIAMGIVRRPPHVLEAQPHLAAWCAVQELQSDSEQLWLMQQHPELLPQLNLRTPLMQWMVAARKDSIPHEILERMPQSAALKETLRLAKMRPARSGGRA
ncbi:hypothetical protein KUF54_15585 [Comamonas sp. Y33R10-2]|uniref:hypothetical protein n=1 Tax=Comamonas sp. Y33R10-2 TaxID=2853257 RepID=UPI001C5CABAB|nr:hypothetical protein [Comamonas sp. Y33R10-2]QXZ11453.1 hypothetical protein KUF54_15585 [Comamonas sp. Y33R10-2]